MQSDTGKSHPETPHDLSMVISTSNLPEEELRSAANNQKDQHLTSTITREKVSALEQRNRHLEIDLKLQKEKAEASKETAKKYKELKADYKELLETFERSEEIRHEQKEMINDQKQQVKALKGKVKL